jgi:hypothetical protein
VSQPGLYTLEVQPREFNLSEERPWNWQVDYVEENFTIGQRSYAGYITFSYADADNATTQIDLDVYEYQNDGNQIFDETITPSGGSGLSDYSTLIPLTEEQIEHKWVVEFDAVRNGTTVEGERVVGSSKTCLVCEIPVWVRQALAFFLLIMLAGIFSPLNASLGAVVVSVVGGLMFFVGWLPGLVTAGGIMLALAVSAVGHISTGERR